MSFEIRELTVEQTPAFRQAIASGFGQDVDPDDEKAIERFTTVFDRNRMYPVYDGENIVGTGGDFELTLTVPGGAQVPMSGLTIITVQPTHTRRGILTAMMRKHVDMARERGEPLGGLWASEVPIYGRYGYGPAAQMHSVKYDARFAGRGEQEPGVTVRLISEEEAKKTLPELYAAAQSTRPGMYQRSEDWWTHRLFFDPEKNRSGASALRHALAERDGLPIGYMTYRQKHSWDTLGEGETRVRELMTIDDGAYRALWHYATNIDLFPIVKHWNLPVDDPLSLLFRDGRTVETTDLSDSLWIRLIDVAAALPQRTYTGSGSLAMQIDDPFCPWNEGTYRLAVADGVATYESVTSEADVAMDVNTLGALYLGGTSAVALSRVGRIEGSSDAVAQLESLFGSPIAPHCAEVF